MLLNGGKIRIYEDKNAYSMNEMCVFFIRRGPGSYRRLAVASRAVSFSGVYLYDQIKNNLTSKILIFNAMKFNAKIDCKKTQNCTQKSCSLTTTWKHFERPVVYTEPYPHIQDVAGAVLYSQGFGLIVLHRQRF